MPNSVKQDLYHIYFFSKIKLNCFRAIKCIEKTSNKSLIRFNVEEKMKVLSRKTMAQKNSGPITQGLMDR